MLPQNTKPYTVETRPNYTCRPMKPSDISAVSEIDQLSQPHPWHSCQFEESLKGVRHSWVIVNTFCGNSISEEIAGMAVFSLIGGDAELLTISIHPNYRRKGLAKALLEHGLTALKPQQLFLEVRRSNHSAIHLYEEIGMNCIGERRNYYPSIPERKLPKEDALIYGLDLSIL